MEASAGGADALEQFVSLAKTAKGRACVALIQQVLNHPKVFVFGELLAMPNIQALRESEHEPHLQLLELFAYGNCGDSQDGLPEMTEAQVRKLRTLTLLTHCQSEGVLGYDQLMASTGVANVRELEDLIIEAIYAGLLDGKLNQRERVLRVSRCAPRDIRDSDIAAVALKLQRWHRNTQRVLTGLQALQVQLREDAASTRDSARAQNAKQRELLSELKKRNAAAVGGEEDVMELELDTRARYGGRARRRVEPNPERARLK